MLAKASCQSITSTSTCSTSKAELCFPNCDPIHSIHVWMSCQVLGLPSE